MNARYVLSNLLEYTGANAAAIAVRRRSLTTLCYHRVLAADDPLRENLDPALVTTSAVFERQMQIIYQHFHPVTLSEVLSWLDGNTQLPPRAALITFDDGLADTYANAFPIMKRLGVPGTVFLATGFIGTCDSHWTDTVRQYIAQRVGPQIASQQIEWLKTLPVAIRAGRICEIMREWHDPAAPVILDSIHDPESRPNLTWDQVSEMSRHGFEFGSHTRNHTILPHEPDDAVVEELTAAAEDLQYRLGHAPASFAYPDGQYDERTVRLLAGTGCRCAFTCDEGAARSDSHPLALPRLLIHDGVSANETGQFSRAMFVTYLAGTIPWRYRRVAK